ncbi:MAG: chitobiase/beta-hexosaminidase C-terminal domain-containing protein, partial [Muribaculaceae bacterium]|nr:chitobiase/beta-hexosaminidase C-terminal domain-containing protein [Muribaculaceae bacterium]
LDEAMTIQKGENAYKIAAGEYDVEVNLAEGTVKFSAVPVVGPSAPVINPNGGEFENEVTVTITAEEADEIRYTLDGSNPNAESTLYAEPIVINEVGTTTVKAIAIKNGLVSDAVSAEFTITNGGGGAKLEVILESKSDIIASGDGRFSTGYGDYIYINDKANGKVVRYDKTGARSDYASVEGLGTGITSDDAGNILVNKGFPGATSGTTWVIIEPSGEQHELALTFPDAVTPARADAFGRVVGDVMSAEGGYFFIAVNGAQKLVAVKIANGEQDDDAIDSPDAQVAFDTTTIAQPRYATVDEIESAADPSTAVVYRKRGNLKVYGWNEDGSEGVDFGSVEGARSCEGFDIFTIGDITYSVEPSTDTNYASGLAVRILGESENLASIGNELFAGGSQRYQSITARVVSNRDAEPYALIYRNVSGEGVSMYKFTPAPSGVNTIGNDADVVATSYYNLQGVRVLNPSAGQILIKVNTLSNGKVSASKVLVR